MRGEAGAGRRPIDLPWADAMTRTGWGYDAHRFGGVGPLVLCGVEVSSDRGLIGTSDADVGLHAVIDAILGASALGDLGELFPSADPQWAEADSAELLAIARALVEEAGFRVVAVDVTIIAETVRVAPHRRQMRDVLAASLQLQLSAVSVKATTTDGMGPLGRDEGIAAAAVATVVHE